MKIVVANQDTNEIVNVESRPRAKTIKVVFENESEGNNLTNKQLQKELNDLIKADTDIELKKLHILAKTLQIETIDECKALILEHKNFTFAPKVKTMAKYGEYYISSWGCDLQEDETIESFGEQMADINHVFFVKGGCFDYVGDSERFVGHIENYNNGDSDLELKM